MGAIRLSLDDRKRRLPPSLQAALKRVPDSYDLAALGDLALAFQNGYTSEDVERVGWAVEQALGLPLIVVWDYVDDFSSGGSSEEFLYQAGLKQLPECLFDLLFEGKPLGGDTLEEALASLAPAGGTDTADIVALDAYNYAVDDRRS
jgi:hypothetical protein